MYYTLTSTIPIFTYPYSIYWYTGRTIHKSQYSHTHIVYVFFPLILSFLLSLICFGSHIANPARGRNTYPAIPNNLNVHLHSSILFIAPDIQPNPPPIEIME